MGCIRGRQETGLVDGLDVREREESKLTSRLPLDRLNEWTVPWAMLREGQACSGN